MLYKKIRDMEITRYFYISSPKAYRLSPILNKFNQDSTNRLSLQYANII